MMNICAGGGTFQAGGSAGGGRGEPVDWRCQVGAREAQGRHQVSGELAQDWNAENSGPGAPPPYAWKE